MKNNVLEEMLAILTAGGRNNGEKSRAFRQSAYKDPAQTVKFEREKKLKKVKKSKRRK